ncbi:DNA polymerase III subunit beta [Vagococcus fluvialis]|uniref:DNA polymerase III subunit beta n=1 Tax=Vagococcus fluvialis TaxID=2738 RepID=UPI0032E4F375
MEIKNLHKHLKRASCQKATRPILQCVHYDEDGSICVTDSHRLLQIKEFHNHKEEFNQDLATMELRDGNYPDITRLIPTEFGTEVTISLTVLIRIMKALGTSTNETVTWNISADKITFSNNSDQAFYGGPIEISANANVTGNQLIIGFRAKLIKECCEFFMDAKERYAVDNVTIKMSSPLRPVVFSIDQSKHIYLVTPVRTN